MTTNGASVAVKGEPVVRIEHVGKTYEPSPTWMRVLLRSSISEPVQALSDVSLDVHEGEICAVVGPNGAGKTTMFRILTGLTTPSAGRASILGFDVDRESEKVRRVIGWMPAEDRSLFMRLSCYENLYFHGRLHGMATEELKRAIPDMLDSVGLAAKMKNAVVSLSAGMRARLQLARALLHQPKLLILDEPTSAVDPVAAHGLLELITSLVAEQRLAALVSSHRLEEIEALHSYVVLLDGGEIRHRGDLDDLRHALERPDVEVVFESADYATSAAMLLEPRFEVVARDGASLRCRLDDGSKAGDLLQELSPLLCRVVHVRELPLPLRDLLAQMYRSAPTLAAVPST